MRKGFLTIEYAVLLAIIMAAFLGMSVYLKRAVCGKWRESADSFGFGRQYEPYDRANPAKPYTTVRTY